MEELWNYYWEIYLEKNNKSSLIPLGIFLISENTFLNSKEEAKLLIVKKMYIYDGLWFDGGKEDSVWY